MKHIRDPLIGWVAMMALPLSASAAGGETCPTATAIGGLPFNDSGSTCQAAGEYNESCPTPSNGPDVVYRFSPVADVQVDIALCQGTNFDAKLYVYASDAGGCPPPGGGDTPRDILCVDAGCPQPNAQVPRISGLNLGAGRTYWIVIDGSNGACGNYQITVTPVRQAACCFGSICATMTPAECLADGGVPFPDSPTCDSSPCRGACCLGPNECDDSDGAGITPYECGILSGTYMPRARCSASPCGSLPCATSLDCDDSDPCTTDTCNPQTQTCGHTAVPGCCKSHAECMDQLYCNGTELCFNHACQPGVAPNCDDGNACTADACDENSDECTHTLNPGCCASDAECDDGNNCTTDACNAGTCQHTPVPAGSACGDAADTACSNPDTCDGAGTCRPNHEPAGTPCGSQTDTACTDPDTCDGQGACHSNHAANNTPCDDGDSCTLNDACLNGVCRGIPDSACGSCTQGGSAIDPTHQIGLQALLTNGAGQPIPGPTVDLSFQFYDLQGTPVGTPIPLAGVPIRNGIVSAGIPINQNVFDGTGREIGISVNGTPELSPRIPVRSTAQSFLTSCVSGNESVSHVRIGSAQRGGALELADASGDTFFSVRSDTGTLRIGDPPRGAPGAQAQAGSSAVGSVVSGVPELEMEELDPDTGHGACELNTVTWLENTEGTPTIVLDPSICPPDNINAAIELRNHRGNTTARLESGGLDYQYGVLRLSDSQETQVLEVSAQDNGTISVGEDSEVRIEGNYGGTGKGIVITDLLKIRGADVSEQFDIDGSIKATPGLLVSIDPDHPGRLVVSAQAYDRKIAGVISGAGGIATGMIMGQPGTIADGQTPVALSGRVYCWADANEGSIEPGDLLTASDVPGHAMKVRDFGRAQGAIIGKAMSRLQEGRGLVLVLVNLH